MQQAKLVSQRLLERRSFLRPVPPASDLLHKLAGFNDSIFEKKGHFSNIQALIKASLNISAFKSGY